MYCVHVCTAAPISVQLTSFVIAIPSSKTKHPRRTSIQLAYCIDMVAGAPSVPASFGTNDGVATPGPASRVAPSGASILVKRPAIRQIAPVPPAPGRDMNAN